MKLTEFVVHRISYWTVAHTKSHRSLLNHLSLYIAQTSQSECEQPVRLYFLSEMWQGVTGSFGSKFDPLRFGPNLVWRCVWVWPFPWQGFWRVWHTPVTSRSSPIGALNLGTPPILAKLGMQVGTEVCHLNTKFGHHWWPPRDVTEHFRFLTILWSDFEWVWYVR